MRRIKTCIIITGIILIVSGFITTNVKGVKITFMLHKGFTVSEVPLKNNKIIDLDFSVSLKDLETGKMPEAILILATEEEVSVEKKMTINRPAEHREWLLYLTSYDPVSEEYIIITMRKDPGRKLAISGMLILLAGIFIIFYSKDMER